MATMRDVDALVSMRLSSSWGRAAASDQKLGILSELHELIRVIEPERVRPDTWDSVLMRCSSHPKEVMQLDRRGRTCLSAACAKNPPFEIVKAMLRECRFGVDTFRDKTGYTSLAIAITSQASLEVLQILVNRPHMTNVSDHRGNTPLHLACNSRYRHGVEELVCMLIQSSPTLAGIENRDGKTPLHLALESKASVEVIRMIVQASPESVVNDACGYTALMCAIQTNANAEVYQCLVEANPQSTLVRDAFGRLPLRCAVEYRCRSVAIFRLLCTSKDAVLESDKIGRNVLHMTLERNSVDPIMVSILLDRAPEASQGYSDYVDRPVVMAFRRYIQACQNIRYQGQATTILAQNERDNWWEVVCLVLRAATFDETSLDPYNMLHAALSFDAPVEVIRTIVQQYPNEVRQRNPIGQSPLMIVAERPMDRTIKDALFEMLLDVDASVAAERDRDGRYALSLVAEHGGVSENVIFRLICACPDAVRMVDRKHHMYPFMIAALPNQRKENKSDNSASKVRQDHNLLHIGAIYELLSAGPDLILMPSPKDSR